MEQLGFIYYDWNASLEDAKSKVDPPEQLVQNACTSAMGRKKVVLLLHDRVPETVDCLPALLDAFADYECRPLSEDVKPVQFRRLWE